MTCFVYISVFVSSCILFIFPATSQVRSPSDEVWSDIYWRGIRVAEIGAVPGDSVSVRRRDPFGNAWGSYQRFARNNLRATSPFSSEIGNIIGRSDVDWHNHDGVAWPDDRSVYRPAEVVEANLNGSTLTATRWAVDDASNPIDLIVSQQDVVLAAISPSGGFIWVVRGYEALTGVSDWSSPEVSQALYGAQQVEDVEFTTSDGLRLATLVFAPSGPGAVPPFPTILIRTPYGIANRIGSYLSYVNRGYAVVLQSTRGRAYWDPENMSEGEWAPMIDEPLDGAETLAWVVKQPWSNGSICMEGGSYLGYTQWTASMADNPALKCLIPESSMGTAFSDQPYRGGGFVEGLAYYVFWMLNKLNLIGRSWNDILHHRPLIDIDEYATGEDIPQWNTFFDHQLNDDYWQRQNWYRDANPRNYSTLQISGWFDDDLTGTQSNWDLMQRTSDRPQALIIGPWKHGYNVDRSLNGYDFGPTSVRNDIFLLKQKWYDHFLKGSENGVDEFGVEFFVLGANEWRRTNSWPPSEVEKRSFYFSSDGTAAQYTFSGNLIESSPSIEEPADEYVYDPANPPSNWYSFDLMQSWADVQRFPYDFKDIEGRGDVATYTTAPLASNVLLAGTIEIELYAATDVLDTDWYVHLSDVYPDNSSVRLSTGMLRARFRNLDDPIHQTQGSNFESEALLSGDIGEIVRYHFTIPAVANLFREGHRIRIAVMNALDNYTFPNFNTGGDEGRVTEAIIGTMRIHHAPQYPSRVILDILPE